MTSRRRVERENTEYAAFARRMIRAYARRVGGSDPADLADMVKVAAEMEEAVHQAVVKMREIYGFSWAEIAQPLGITRQAAQQRYGKKNVA